MFFYDDFIKKIEKTNIDYKAARSYRLETKKIVMWLGTGVPLIMIGILQGYIGYTKGFSLPYIGMAALMLYLGGRHMKNLFGYKIVIDSEKKHLLGQGLDLAFDEIESCNLRESVVGKGSKLQVVIRIVTKDKREIIIPLIMNKKIEFICVLRDALKERFTITKG